MIYWKTVNDLLRETLLLLMRSKELDEFRLVGGTALSLQLGHRMSVDIDLFTDTEYGSMDFKSIESFLEANFSYVDKGFGDVIGMGKSYLVGSDVNDTIKLDLYYTTDPFIEPPLIIEEIRMATLNEIIAMKVDVIQRTGRKKDFWDLYEVLSKYSIKDMIALHKSRYKYSHDEVLIRGNFVNFSEADDDFEPICLRGNYWEFIKEDIINAIEKEYKTMRKN
ncbi:nucleotidyl transferase AbiEii/AbiGii toxin family protein [Flavobacterium psychrotrophum]|uniref:nucleotidyl transferase AbiEii/AbiGii toxin family protein n=1 Tax=Flavobacterium psychrotrophum TaxID=2294119 RepID=UPI000E31683F|nr:nucleotidyl transferase AbiEii/AbiGii toxin family protein [Flavobacterium psychrotrophum]